MAIKKYIVKKKIEGVIYDIYSKTSADLVDYSNTISVADQIANMIEVLDSLTTGNNSVDEKIKQATDNLYNQIMGVSSKEQLNEAFDTLKEISDYLNDHGAIVQGFITEITTLKETLGNLNNGIIKDTNDLKTIVGDSTNGLVNDINTLKSVQSTKVEESEINGNIKINNIETQVYDDSTIDASKIVEDDSHKFTTPTEKIKWNSKGEISVGYSVENLGEMDMMFLIIGSSEGTTVEEYNGTLYINGSVTYEDNEYNGQTMKVTTQ